MNVAEGHGDSNAQFNRFLQIAKNSVNECVVCNTIAFRRGYVNKKEHEQNRYILSELSKMISGLTKYLKSNN